jgi:gamma-glutamyltranspeptidase/glutathione hydrolase
MGPPSSGGVLLLQMLHMLEAYPLEELGWNSTDSVHLLTEVARRAYADRARYLGDPDFRKMPIETLVSRDYARKRAAGISMTRATPSEQVSAGIIDPGGQPPESDETTHLSVIDREGNAVAMTTTLNASFGSGIVAAGTGILLNDEMDDFSAKPGVANYYGLIGSEANAIAPGKRMLSSMSPTLLLRGGKPVLVLGSPGGSKIITSVLQVILNHLIFAMPISQAVAVPRVHAQWLPDQIYIESYGLAGEIVRRLEERGHRVVTYPGPIGRVNAIAVRPDGFHAGPDIRGACAAAGY